MLGDHFVQFIRWNLPHVGVFHSIEERVRYDPESIVQAKLASPGLTVESSEQELWICALSVCREIPTR